MPLCALHSLATQPPVLNFRRDAAWALERTRISSLLLKEGREEKRREEKNRKVLLCWLVNALSSILEGIVAEIKFISKEIRRGYPMRQRLTDEYNSFQMTWQSSPSQQTALPHRRSSAAGNAASGYLSLEPRPQKSRASSNLDPS